MKTIFFLLLLGSTAFARGEWPPTAYSAWFQAQYNKAGQWCCDKADGHRYDDDYRLLSDGSAELADGTIVPPSEVLTGPNPTGSAILWYVLDMQGQKRIYCFAPEPEG